MTASAPNDPLTDRILERLEPAISGPPVWLRVVLVVVSVGQLALSVPWLIGSDPIGLMGDASASHLTRDGALGLALASAGLCTAWRPRYAVAATLIALAALVTQVATAVVDDHFRRISLFVETIHGLTVIITALVAWAARPVKPRPKRQQRLRVLPGTGSGPTQSR